MRLDLDCIRDILLETEDVCSPRHFFEFPSETKYLSKYPNDVVLYHIKQCELSDLLYKVKWMLGGNCLVTDLTPQGHQFIANIRTDTNWNKVKEISENVGSTTIMGIIQIATGVITNMINQRFTLN